MAARILGRANRPQPGVSQSLSMKKERKIFLTKNRTPSSLEAPGISNRLGMTLALFFFLSSVPRRCVSYFNSSGCHKRGSCEGEEGRKRPGPRMFSLGRGEAILHSFGVFGEVVDSKDTLLETT